MPFSEAMTGTSTASRMRRSCSRWRSGPRAKTGRAGPQPSMSTRPTRCPATSSVSAICSSKRECMTIAAAPASSRRRTMSRSSTMGEAPGMSGCGNTNPRYLVVRFMGPDAARAGVPAFRPTPRGSRAHGPRWPSAPRTRSGPPARAYTPSGVRVACQAHGIVSRYPTRGEFAKTRTRSRANGTRRESEGPTDGAVVGAGQPACQVLEGPLERPDRAPAVGADALAVERLEHTEAQYHGLPHRDPHAEGRIQKVVACGVDAEVGQVAVPARRHVWTRDRRRLAQAGELAPPEQARREREPRPPVLAARRVHVELPGIVRRAPAQVADAGIDPRVQIRVEPTADHVGRQREVGADLSVAGAEPLPGVAAGEADPDSGCADGAAELAVRLEDAILCAQQHVRDVAGVLVGHRGAPHGASRNVLSRDVEAHVEGNDGDGDVEIEVVEEPVGDVERPDGVEQVGRGLVADLGAGADRHGKRIVAEDVAVVAVDVVVPPGDADVDQAIAQRLRPLGEGPR